VSKLDFLEKLGGSISQVTTSQGIACFPMHAQDAEGLREKADQALYIAKERGRNRSALAPIGDNGAEG
ncbi:MAG: diguanylate cyclase, partial [Spirochaetes bacterium]|nr:diguanylate cyclase [Spirochaetota bacterium]